ncbi:MAG TPA: beta-propeller domain-containing protein [Solirubrobacteraceae bacterium]|nr:beta-propeller domain-containing protein [Solirubrobacteraceae bacterium]
MRRLLLTLAVALTALGAAVPAEAAKRRVVKKQLTTFRSCAGLTVFAERRVRRFGSEVFAQRRPFAIASPVAMPMPARDGAGAPTANAEAAPAAPVAGTDFSTTNVQEAGVDEPDAVKTDGRRLYVAMGNRVHAIDIGGAEPKLVATLELEGYSSELLLRDGKLLVIASGGFAGPVPVAERDEAPAASGAPAPFIPYVPRTQLLEVDAADLRVVRTLEIPGTVVGGRLRGSTARIAISTPTGLPVEEGTPKLRRWMPAMELRRSGRTFRRSIAPCTSVRRPQVFAGLGLLTLLTIDLDRGVNPVDSDAVLADATTVYASPRRMYLATERWTDPDVAQEEGVPIGRSTTIHGFDVSAGDATGYVGSGSVRGYLLNQFSLSEHGGALRVATTEEPPWFLDGVRPGESESFVTVLDERDKRLVEVGRVGGLGRGERIYAVRFVGDVGFVVTFRQTDPLYTLDLSDRTAPRVVGELKIPGYSSYLHPIGDDLVLGVGQDATDEGRVRGAQVSLFDVSDLRDPRRLHQKTFGTNAYTLAESDHHAFLWWPATRLLVLPLTRYASNSREDSFYGAVGLRVDRASGFRDAGRTEHPEVDGYAPQIMRALVAGDRLYTISANGVQAGRLDTLAGTAWVPFPTG